GGAARRRGSGSNADWIGKAPDSGQHAERPGDPHPGPRPAEARRRKGRPDRADAGRAAGARRDVARRDRHAAGPACPGKSPSRDQGALMRTERFTTKAQEAILAAQQMAEGEGHPELMATHLLLSLVDQPDGVVHAAVDRAGIDVPALAGSAREALGRLPHVSGQSQLSLSNEARRVLTEAHAVAERMHDEYVSTEHLLLAIIEDATGSEGRRLLTDRGLDGAALMAALTSIRG